MLEADALEMDWRTFYESTYNPARTRLNLPDQRTLKKRWRNLPEPKPVLPMARSVGSRVEDVIEPEAAGDATFRH